MRQRRLFRTVVVEKRTLSAVPVTLGLCLVASIRADFVELQGRSQLLWLEDEGLAEGLDIARLGLAIALSLAFDLALLALLLLLVFPLSEAFLEEGRYGVGDALELLVAFGLCSFEATGDMSPDERHRYHVRTGPMGVACAACAGLGLDGVVEDGLGAEDERTWRLSSRHARVGHVCAVVGREGRVVVARRWEVGMLEEGSGDRKREKRREWFS